MAGFLPQRPYDRNPLPPMRSSAGHLCQAAQDTWIFEKYCGALRKLWKTNDETIRSPARRGDPPDVEIRAPSTISIKTIMGHQPCGDIARFVA
jgi:hypothetical protein